ncbi:DNA internalization-related competence protein ComEC/Rec2 [Rhodohalobacter barkolensis]|nr:DNA internalization-related competence protein ComEC/Rec2 [Rhodohalobacter barkolensis]
MLLIMLGIAWDYYSNINLFFSAVFFTSILILWGITEFLLRRYKIVLSSRLSIILYLILIISASFVWIKVADHNRQVHIEKTKFLELYAWENVVIEGLIKEKGFTAGGKRVYTIDVISTVYESESSIAENYRIRLYDDKPGRDLQNGTELKAEIQLYAFPEIRNPHDFDYGGWLHDQNIVAHGELVQLNGNSYEQKRIGWIKIREYVQNNIDKLFSADLAPMAKALFLGYKAEISDDTKQHFSRSGLSHIMAVSGLHVGFIVAPFWFIIPFLWTRKWGKWLGLLLLTFLLLGYAGLTGFSASVSRASLMAWLITYGKLFSKVRNSINLTAGAAIILLIIDPHQLFDVGFQLSFSAVFTILLLMPEAQRLIPIRYRFGKTGALATLVLISVVVQGGLFPVLTYYFGEFSIAGPVANAFVIPLMTVAVPVGLFFSVLPQIFYPFTTYAVFPVEWSLGWVEGVAEYIGSSDLSYFSFTNDSGLLFLLWLILILLLASSRIPEMKWKLLICVLFVLNLFMLEQTFKKSGDPVLRITFLDVGQGDAIHIQTPSQKHILVDAGRWSPGYDSGSRVINPYLKHVGIDEIDAVILSHPHADHIGGIVTIIENFKVQKIYQSSYAYDSQLYQNFLGKTDELDLPIKNIYAGDQIELEENIRIYVLGPMMRSSNPSNPNNSSVAVKVVYGDQSILLTGDAESQQESKMVNIYGDFLKSNLYKMGHHGSRTSSTETLLEIVEPEISVASLAFRNRFRHPNRDAVSRVSKFTQENYFTSLQGAVVFESDGKSIIKVDWK